MAGTLQEIFENVLGLHGGARETYLNSACGGNQALRDEVTALLRAHDQAEGFLSAPTTDSGAADTMAAPLREAPGSRIGPYKLLQLIGEGGFGSVFMAEQEKPVARKVALKIIKLGMDTRQVVARFEQERQALAMMDHPNIARVLSAGATDTGRPYFVMELVKGDPIVEYCDKNNLSIEDRLELLAQVCNAVQHAHTKGIIHRDIKPSNILVSTQDGRPNTKVIDFGIAKATASKLTEKTLFTEHGALIGTPEYMSPEQAEGSLDIDTRTDVYSLGVLLYELLTGTTPFGARELRSAAFAEIQRIIREVDPPKPSTRLSANTDTLANVAARRHIEPKRLGAVVRGELDWIVMRAMEKDRQRRYESASGLAMDIRRYLSGEAVLAAPPSAAYRFRKFVSRNRVMVTSGSVVAAALLIGVVAFAWQARVARDQRDWAVAARQEADAQRDRAIGAEANALTSAEHAKQARTTAENHARLAEIQATLALGAIQNLVTAANTGLNTQETRAFKKSVLDVALANIGRVSEFYEKSTSKEATSMAIHSSLGNLLLQLGQSDRGLVHLQNALEIAVERVKITEHSDPSRMNLARSHISVANAVAQVGRDMEAVLEHNLKASQVLQDVYDHPKLDGFSANRNEVTTLLSEAILNVGVTFSRLGDTQSAIAYCRRALAMNEELARAEPDAAYRQQTLCLSYLAIGHFLVKLGDTDEAVTWLERAVDMRTRLCALPTAGYRERGDLASAYYLFGDLHARTGKVERARELLVRSLELRREVAANDPENIADQRFLSASLYLLGNLSERRGDPAAAAAYFAESRAIKQRLSEQDPTNDKRRMELMLVLPHVGEAEAGAVMADGFADSHGTDNEMRVDLACCYAQCARVTPPEQADLSRLLRAKALRVLHDAVQNGYSDRFKLATEPDLAPLFKEAEFVVILDSIRAKN